MTVHIRPIPAEDTHLLRQKILRPHQALEDMVYPLDHLHNSFHVGAFRGNHLVGIASLYPESADGSTNRGEWRLRGMAVDKSLQGQGLGKNLVQVILKHAKDQHADLVWCNARTSAMGFYLNLGFEIQGEEFDIPGIGPHLVARIVL